MTRAHAHDSPRARDRDALLPVRRNVEIDDAVPTGPNSVVVDEAERRCPHQADASAEDHPAGKTVARLPADESRPEPSHRDQSPADGATDALDDEAEADEPEQDRARTPQGARREVGLGEQRREKDRRGDERAAEAHEDAQDPPASTAGRGTEDERDHREDARGKDREHARDEREPDKDEHGAMVRCPDDGTMTVPRARQAGRLNQNLVRSPADSTPTVPPTASTSCFTMASPIPAPPWLRSRDLLTR